jgi:hypothetical protein
MDSSGYMPAPVGGTVARGSAQPLAWRVQYKGCSVHTTEHVQYTADRNIPSSHLLALP